MIALLCALAAAPPLVEVSLAPEVGWRRVSFRDRLTPSLAGYQSGALALLRLGLAVYPAGASRLPLISDVSFYGSYARSLKSRHKVSRRVNRVATLASAWVATTRSGARLCFWSSWCAVGEVGRSQTESTASRQWW